MSLRTIFILVNGIAGAALLAGFLAAARAAASAVTRTAKESAAPPNQTEYYGDKALEGPRLEHVLGISVLFSAVLAASLPMYWLLEPDRQGRMSEDFLADSIERGKLRFSVAGTFPPSEVASLECAGCHGDKAQGGGAAFLLQPDEPGELPRQVTWSVPSLDDVFLRWDSEEGRAQIKWIITYGRPGTPMPTWGLEGGGSLNDQAIEDLLNYLQSIQITPEEAKKRNTEKIETVMEENPGISLGQAAFMANCARCHTKGYSYGDPGPMGGGGAFGPNLTNAVTLRQFPALTGGFNEHNEFVSNGPDFQKAYGTNGIGSGRMPGFKDVLTQEQIDQIVLYERTL